MSVGIVFAYIQENTIFMVGLKMKILVKVSTIFLALAFSVNSWAYTLGGTDVGSVDNILYTASLGNSSDAEEEAWVESVLGFDVGFEYRSDGAFSWDTVDGETDIYAQLLDSDPEFYLVKLGGGNFLGDTHVLYDNAASLSYAVIDLLALGQGATIDIARVSHISEYNGTSVPEPGTLALFGLGLLGLVLVARRKS